MIVRQVNSSTAELYEVDQRYEKFNQKNNLMIQPYWNKKIKQLENLRIEKLKKYVQENKSGYSAFDYAFFSGALSYMNNIDYGINLCDQTANSWDYEFSENNVFQETIERADFTNAVKKAAKMYGASAVGITLLDRRWVYSHWFDKESGNNYPLVFSDENEAYQGINKPTLLDNGIRVLPEKMKSVIVFLFEMDYECLQYSPTLLACGESVNVYSKMSLATMSMTGFIKTLGYNAIPSINCTALNIPLAIDAGLGQLGRNGKLINPQFGSRSRISKVITDLPLTYDKPIDFGVTEFCEACMKCARECPTRAISSGPRVKQAIDETGNSYYLRWIVDHKKCFQYWCECGTNCNVCLYVCSYNRGYKWTKTILNSSNETNSLIDTLIDALDDDYGLELLKNKTDSFWKKF